MNDIDRLIGVAKSFREATTDAAPTEGSIIGLWMATASALESTTARLREAEANLATETAAHDDTIRERDRISARLREAESAIAKVRARTHPEDETIRPILAAYKTTKTENRSES